ncbi:MAG: fibronectin type III-like domain-contianing protein, partial [Muribaculaceae bacterium]|nr:fibronectin type III-like domain-contianing protein [Muribaculaceae bacterium]
NPGRDYVFSSPKALWSFGHGLSYTTYEYDNAMTDKNEYNPYDTIRVSVDVTNTGNRDGKEVVQVYVRDVVSSTVTPVRQLKGFEKVEVAAGKTCKVNIEIPVRELYMTDEAGNRYMEPGKFEIQVGKSSTDIKHRLAVWVGEKAPVEQKCEDVSKATKDSGKSKKNNTIKVTGCVRDIQATPIEGVTVRCSITGANTLTDSGGNFTIIVPADTDLTFTKDGYSRYSKAIKGSKIINAQIVRE